MNQIASSLGMQLPFLKARDVVMRPCQRQVSSSCATTTGLSRMDLHRDSLLCLSDAVKLSPMPDFFVATSKKQHKNVEQDDDTASTVSSIDESFSGSSSVTFCEPLVTHVYERPMTTLAEKHVLFYSDIEYRNFRRDYLLSKQRRNSTVQFSDDVVTSVHEYDPVNSKKEDLFYNDEDLQRFLDEFVASLNESPLS